MSITTAVGIITAGIALGVVISKQIDDFQNSKVVLQSPATIVLNRFIELNELPFFYDVVATMNIVLDDIKQVLQARFGEQFVHVELTNFSLTPNVTSANQKKTTSKRALSFEFEYGKSVSTTYDNCTISVLISNCTNNVTSKMNNASCGSEVFEITNCSNANNSLLAKLFEYNAYNKYNN